MKKNYLMISVFLTLFTSNFIVAQESINLENQNDLPSISEKSLQRAVINYYTALQRENAGVIESAMINIMIMKLFFPERDYEKFISKLSELTTEGMSKQIRYKAFIACNYLKHPERYNWIKKDSIKETTDFFNNFSDKLAKQLQKTEESLLVISN